MTKFFLNNLYFFRLMFYIFLILIFTTKLMAIIILADIAYSFLCYLIGRLYPVKFKYQPYSAFTIIPFIFFKDNLTPWLEDHEYIHGGQEIALGLPLFLLIYGANFLVNLIIYKNVNQAYKNIIFEKEAYGTL